MSDFSSDFFALQSPGQREYQEDDYGLLDARVTGRAAGQHTVVVVADGMGGHVGGAYASKLATERFIEAYQVASGSIPERLQLALNAANSALTVAIKGNAELKGMGATLVAAVVHESKLYWISVGDSPMWLFRDRQLHRLNANHSMAPVLQQMVADGRMTQEQADNDPGRHSLLSALTGETVELIDLGAEGRSLQHEDLLLLASDGLLTLSTEQIAGILANGAELPVAELASRLNAAIEAAALPGQDNITIALYRCNLDRLAAVAEPPTLPVSKRAAVAGRGYRSWLLPVCLGLLFISGVLFFLLNARDRAVDTAADVLASPDQDDAQITAPPPQQVDPPTGSLPETGAEPAAEPLAEPPKTPAEMPAETPAEIPVEDQSESAKQPEGDGVPAAEPDGAADEKTE